jgi:cell division protease FtsH
MKFKNVLKNMKGILIAAAVVIMMLVVLVQLTSDVQSIGTLSYKTFLEAVRDKEVAKVLISGQDVQGKLKTGETFQTTIPNRSADYDILEQNDVDMELYPISQSVNWYYFFLLMLTIAALLGLWYFFGQNRGNADKNSGAGGMGIFGIGKSRAKMFLPSSIKENFDSVAGAQEAKEDLQELVDFLKNPVKYRKLGAQITKGVLLVGEPGTGKTLLARAVAGEANCPFFSVSGSDFIEVFVGVGAARVRDLFAQARKQAPCIVFIDEIDAVGRQRGSGLGGGNDEREQTLNQLLTEMDGFESNVEPIIVIAATNRADVLDKALLRPGRFDRQIEVPMPDLKSREDILKVHLKKIKAADDVDAYKIARGTPGYTGADLANLVNEAALAASRHDLDVVSMAEFEAARDKLMLGKENRTMVQTPKELAITAYHEAGHAIVRLLMPEVMDPLHKVTIVPRGRALGVTHYLPERDKYSTTKEELLAHIASALGGRAAEEVVFNTVTTGAYSDFQAASKTARSMVRYYGMSDALGKVVYDTNNEYNANFSEQTFERIDKEVQKIIDEQYAFVVKMLHEHRDKLDVLAKALLEKETMYASEIYELLGIAPRENLKLVE